MMMEKIVRILKKIQIKNILILIALLVFNSYAWFLYATRASSSLDVHISSWNVEFSLGEDETVTNILIEVERIYPGMEKFIKEITVKNKGEIKAHLDYRINYLKIMEEEFRVGENITSEELEEKIKTEYPFKINVSKDETALVSGTGEGKFTVTVEWAFESGDDEADTVWGNKAYEYYSKNTEGKIIEIELELIANQITEQK